MRLESQRVLQYVLLYNHLLRRKKRQISTSGQNSPSSREPQIRNEVPNSTRTEHTGYETLTAALLEPAVSPVSLVANSASSDTSCSGRFAGHPHHHSIPTTSLTSLTSKLAPPSSHQLSRRLSRLGVCKLAAGRFGPLWERHRRPPTSLRLQLSPFKKDGKH